MMKQNQWQIVFFVMIFMTIYVLFSPEMYNSILGRAVVVFTILLLAKYNFMLGLGLVLVAIYMYPDANYMNYMEGMTTETTDSTTATATPATTSATPATTSTPILTSSTVDAKKEDIKNKVSDKSAGSGTEQIKQDLAKHMETILNNTKKLGITSDTTTPTEQTKESFTNNKKTNGTTDRISKEEKLRPKSSVTPQLYQGRGHGVSTSSYQDPSPNESMNLGFAFLS